MAYRKDGAHSEGANATSGQLERLERDMGVAQKWSFTVSDSYLKLERK